MTVNKLCLVICFVLLLIAALVASGTALLLPALAWALLAAALYVLSMIV